MFLARLATVLVIVFVLLELSEAQQAYCSICPDHTNCLYKSTTPSARCYRNNKKPKIINISPYKTTILNLHNQLRRKVAHGQEKRGNPGPQPRAKAMPSLVWDDKLQYIAQRWANQCNWGHDKCRNLPNYYVGQNLAYLASNVQLKSSEIGKIIKKMITMWYEEVAIFPNYMVKKYQGGHVGGKQVGHYTQMVWSKSKTVGCAAILYTDELKHHRIYLVCNYGPGGNVLGKPVY